jgi:hypothetical protein
VEGCISRNTATDEVATSDDVWYMLFHHENVKS